MTGSPLHAMLDNDEQLLRYNSNIMLPEIGIEGQQKLLDSHVVIIGCGGLGSPIALYLAASGVGQLSLADFDRVEIGNLQRQIAHQHKDIGINKSLSCKQSCQQINPDIQINTIEEKLTLKSLSELLQKANLVIDATDNFNARFTINRASVATQTPLISGAAIRLEAQFSVYRPDLPDSPCYHCLYKEQGNEDQLCSQNGIIAPLVGMIGSMQALEAIKTLLNIGQSPVGVLHIFDAKYHQWRSLKFKKDPKCPVCNTFV